MLPYDQSFHVKIEALNSNSIPNYTGAASNIKVKISQMWFFEVHFSEKK